jgi:hypothetical protein
VLLGANCSHFSEEGLSKGNYSPIDTRASGFEFWISIVPTVAIVMTPDLKEALIVKLERQSC